MNQLFEKNKKNDDRKLKKCLANDIRMIYIIDNEEYLNSKYHFDIAEPFSGNVNYEIMHVKYLESYITHLVAFSRFLGQQ